MPAPMITTRWTGGSCRESELVAIGGDISDAHQRCNAGRVDSPRVGPFESLGRQTMSRRVPITTHRPVGTIGVPALALAVALAAAMSAAGAARAAATLSFDRACYVITKRVPTMRITGTGYVPHSHVLITSTANVDASVTANAAGAISTKVRAPAPHFAKPSVKQVTFTAKDEGTNPAVAASGIARVAPMG